MLDLFSSISFDEWNRYTVLTVATNPLFNQLTAQIAMIISGFISFGTLHTKTPNFEPWQWWAYFTTS